MMETVTEMVATSTGPDESKFATFIIPYDRGIGIVGPLTDLKDTFETPHLINVSQYKAWLQMEGVMSDKEINQLADFLRERKNRYSCTIDTGTGVSMSLYHGK